MLLYTRVAQPKTPKRRSRSGCTFCKEKKKKCDEERPSCSRCAERGLDCYYETVKPRQRRKRDSMASSTAFSHIERKLSCASTRRRSNDSESSSQDDWIQRRDDDIRVDEIHESDILFSPVDNAFDTSSLPTLSLPDLSDLSPSGSDFPLIFEDDDVSEKAVVPSSSRTVTRTSRALDLAMIAPCPLGSPTLEFCIPAFSEFSDRTNRRALVDHFCNVLSHLIVFREESGNPFQQLVLPLTQKSSPVMNAIYALASAHLEYRGVENGEKSLYFHNQAIQGLATLIEKDGKVNRNEILAAIMLLVYYEVLVQKGRSNIVDGHLKGALTVMSSNPEPTDPTGIFLERAFRFYDVIAALSFGTAPLSTAPATGCLLPLSPQGAPIVSAMSSVDTLLGMATSLWPIIHRLSGLSSLKREMETALRTYQTSSKIAVLRTEFETTAEAIESALHQWQPFLPAGFNPDDVPSPEADGTSRDYESEEKSRLHSIFHNAMAYRHSAFVYLYHTIYGYPRCHASVQSHAHTALLHCLGTCSHAGPMGALLWPLFVSACEAITVEDRELARDAFQRVEKRQGMKNIQRAWEIVQEVWRRADMMQADDDLPSMDVDGRWGSTQQIQAGFEPKVDLWRRVSEDMGINVVFG